MKKVKHIILAFLKKFPGFRPLARLGVRVAIGCFYRLCCLFFPVDDKVIFFESFLGRSYSDSPRAIYEYLLTDPRFSDYTFVWTFRDIKKADFLTDRKRTKAVKFMASPDYFKYRAKAGVWIGNSRLYAGITRRKKQQYIQTWHGSPLKRLAYDIEQGNNAMNSARELRQKYDMDTKQYTALLSYSPFCTEKFTTAFGLEKLGLVHIIKEVGAPRNDMIVPYIAAKSADFKVRLGIDPAKKVLLYAPTWRDNQYDAKMGYTHKNELDFDRLRREIGKDWVVLFRAHYHVANQFDFAAYEGFVVDASKEEDIIHLFPAADLLVTDYSSVFFDFALLERPMVFYMYDLEEYRDETRGFYFGLDELPGPVIQTMDELISTIVNLPLPDHKKLRAFKEKFLCLDDGEASRRVADLVVGNSE
ncbi:MAG: CDP-glycerol glycerophosphotransferase family protein [Oscillospiraceae bacterium]|nr:CDP-glycerol glycerophosphotransferase family protein [Oscillospiraceae bacterium]